MGCQYYDPCHQGATSFTIAMPRLTFGRGCLNELGQRVVNRGLKNVALITDPHLEKGPIVEKAVASLKAAGVKSAVFSDIKIEPTDQCAERCASFLTEAKVDAVVSVGGGSAIDTCKAALILHRQGGRLQRFFAAPVGQGEKVEEPLLPHIACSTTSGTGSECTSMSVIRVGEFNTKFVVASPYLLPVEAIVDPECTDSLPAMAVASTGYDLLCHALECFTARAYTKYPGVEDVASRQLIQGANPWSELIASKALQIVDKYLDRGVNDRSDREANDQLMWGATLAGMAFGNTGTHLAHALSYGITHLMHDITTPDYPVASPFVPHGISVMVLAPSVFSYTAEATPERHLEAAHFLGCKTQDAAADDSGELLSERLISLMKATHAPNGLSGVGFSDQHTQALAESAFRQKRAIANAPRDSNLVDVTNVFSGARSYW